MAWAARHLFDPQVSGAGPDGDAVVAGLDAGPGNRHVARPLDVDAVGVGAVPRRHDVDSTQLHVLAAEDHDVEQLAVDRRQAVDGDVLGVDEGQRLQPGEQTRVA